MAVYGFGASVQELRLRIFGAYLGQEASSCLGFLDLVELRVAGLKG